MYRIDKKMLYLYNNNKKNNTTFIYVVFLLTFIVRNNILTLRTAEIYVPFGGYKIFINFMNFHVETSCTPTSLASFYVKVLTEF